jgi:Zn-dependent M28 family amino/carboxypeptidase
VTARRALRRLVWTARLGGAITAVLAGGCADPSTAPNTLQADALAVRQVAESISADEFARLVGIIADDSMRGRATPSPELELTAAFIAESFRSVGLIAGGDAGSFIQRYPVTSPQGIVTATPPNTIGILEGSDATLRHEYILVSAHMDHVGVTGGGQNCAASGADSICNGANDNGSGTVGVMQLARAFAALPRRPARTVIFALFSGEERGLWGSAHFAKSPARPLSQAVAVLNIDMIGRNATDSLVVVGKSYSTLGEVTDRITRAHPEVGMRLVDDPWNGTYFTRSDQYSFAKLGAPSIFFFNGTHADVHTARDAVSLLNADAAARAVRMIFYVAHDVASARQRPSWDPVARTRWVAPVGR